MSYFRDIIVCHKEVMEAPLPYSPRQAWHPMGSLSIRQANTGWVVPKQGRVPLQMELPLPMIVEYPSKTGMAADLSGKHLVRHVFGENPHYVIDTGPYEIEFSY